MAYLEISSKRKYEEHNEEINAEHGKTITYQNTKVRRVNSFPQPNGTVIYPSMMNNVSSFSKTTLT
jgi:hypothetical protein